MLRRAWGSAERRSPIQRCPRGDTWGSPEPSVWDSPPVKPSCSQRPRGSAAVRRGHPLPEGLSACSSVIQTSLVLEVLEVREGDNRGRAVRGV